MCKHLQNPFDVLLSFAVLNQILTYKGNLEIRDYYGMILKLITSKKSRRCFYSRGSTLAQQENEGLEGVLWSGE